MLLAEKKLREYTLLHQDSIIRFVLPRKALRPQGETEMKPQREKPDVLDVEIIEPDGMGGDNRHYGRCYSRFAGSRGDFGGYWTSGVIDSGGCMAPAITFALFFICLGHFGLLAAIGFFVFHVIGSILGGVWQARRLMEGAVYNPWAWRVANWAVSFMLTMWLAGGFYD